MIAPLFINVIVMSLLPLYVNVATSTVSPDGISREREDSRGNRVVVGREQVAAEMSDAAADGSLLGVHNVERFSTDRPVDYRDLSSSRALVKGVTAGAVAMVATERFLSSLLSGSSSSAGVRELRREAVYSLLPESDFREREARVFSVLSKLAGSSVQRPVRGRSDILAFFRDLVGDGESLDVVRFRNAVSGLSSDKLLDRLTEFVRQRHKVRDAQAPIALLEREKVSFAEDLYSVVKNIVARETYADALRVSLLDAFDKEVRENPDRRLSDTPFWSDAMKRWAKEEEGCEEGVFGSFVYRGEDGRLHTEMYSEAATLLRAMPVAAVASSLEQALCLSDIVAAATHPDFDVSTRGALGQALADEEKAMHSAVTASWLLLHPSLEGNESVEAAVSADYGVDLSGSAAGLRASRFLESVGRNVPAGNDSIGHALQCAWVAAFGEGSGDTFDGTVLSAEMGGDVSSVSAIAAFFLEMRYGRSDRDKMLCSDLRINGVIDKGLLDTAMAFDQEFIVGRVNEVREGVVEEEAAVEAVSVKETDVEEVDDGRIPWEGVQAVSVIRFEGRNVDQPDLYFFPDTEGMTREQRLAADVFRYGVLDAAVERQVDRILAKRVAEIESRGGKADIRALEKEIDRDDVAAEVKARFLPLSKKERTLAGLKMESTAGRDGTFIQWFVPYEDVLYLYRGQLADYWHTRTPAVVQNRREHKIDFFYDVFMSDKGFDMRVKGFDGTLHRDSYRQVVRGIEDRLLSEVGLGGLFDSDIKGRVVFGDALYPVIEHGPCSSLGASIVVRQKCGDFGRGGLELAPGRGVHYDNRIENPTGEYMESERVFQNPLAGLRFRDTDLARARLEETILGYGHVYLGGSRRESYGQERARRMEEERSSGKRRYSQSSIDFEAKMGMLEDRGFDYDPVDFREVKPDGPIVEKGENEMPSNVELANDCVSVSEDPVIRAYLGGETIAQREMRNGNHI